MGKWTRRAFITTGVLAGGALAVGVALRPGHRAPKVASQVTEDGEVLVSLWVKIAPDNTVTLIAPHSEMGQGAHTALTQMLADELDARWDDVAYLEAPAIDEYANWALGKGFLVGDADIPAALVPTVDGAMLQAAKAIKLQITGGSTSIRATGVYGVRVAGAAARQLLLEAASEAWVYPWSSCLQRTRISSSPVPGDARPSPSSLLPRHSTRPRRRRYSSVRTSSGSWEPADRASIFPPRLMAARASGLTPRCRA